jgi:hypothetical protein
LPDLWQRSIRTCGKGAPPVAADVPADASGYSASRCRTLAPRCQTLPVDFWHEIWQRPQGTLRGKHPLRSFRRPTMSRRIAAVHTLELVSQRRPDHRARKAEPRRSVDVTPRSSDRLLVTAEELAARLGAGPGTVYGCSSATSSTALPWGASQGIRCRRSTAVRQHPKIALLRDGGLRCL